MVTRPLERRVALLRGVNVGTAKRIAMADLRRLFGKLGYHDVRTLLNSGNVVYSGRRTAAAAEAQRLERAIEDELRVSTQVTVLSAMEVAAAVDANPLREFAADPARLLLWVLGDAVATVPLEPLLAQRWEPERIALAGRVAYFWCANGISKSEVLPAAGRILGATGTARNLATMEKLKALVADLG